MSAATASVEMPVASAETSRTSRAFASMKKAASSDTAKNVALGAGVVVGATAYVGVSCVITAVMVDAGRAIIDWF